MLKVVVLISGGGSNLKALLDAAAEPGYPAHIVAVGSDTDAAGLDHARAAGVPSFVVRPRDYADRAAWGDALAAEIRGHLKLSDISTSSMTDSSQVELVETKNANNDYLVVSAGLMRVLPANFVREFSPRLINTHPALLPLFPGSHAVRDALAAGATKTGVTVHIIDEGVDTGPVLRQRVVAILADTDEDTLHEQIKQIERPLLVETVRDIANGSLQLSQN